MWQPTNEDYISARDTEDKLGYGPDPTCVRCHGSGWQHPIAISGRPDYSRVVMCDCFRDAYDAYKAGDVAMARKGVTARGKTFENFKKVPGTAIAFNAMRALASGATDRPLVLVYGSVGNGKTHLCEAATRVLNQRGLDARLFTFADLMSTLKKAINDNNIESLVRELSEVEALIVDDIRIAQGSVWEMGKLEQIIDARYREQRITVLVTNRELDELPETLVSRFLDTEVGTIVLNSGEDYRPRQR